jgi:hypothetical protein
MVIEFSESLHGDPTALRKAARPVAEGVKMEPIVIWPTGAPTILIFFLDCESDAIG